jgi:anthranilate phosphoribosyltransferase
MDEISPAGLTQVWEVQDGETRSWEVNPATFGLECGELDGLEGGEPGENATRIEETLAGRGATAVRCAVLLNAAAALYVAGRGWTFEEAVKRSRAALDSGAAAAVLTRLRAAASAVNTSG